MGFIHVLHKLCQEEREKASLGFFSLCLNLRKPLIRLRFPYVFLSFFLFFFIVPYAFKGSWDSEKCPREEKEGFASFLFFNSSLWTLCMCSIFCLFMDFSFVYFSVVLGSLWRVIYPFSVDNLGAWEVLKPLIWLRLWISGVGFEIAPENGEKVEITLCPFFLFLFSLVLRFFLAFCSGCRERSGEILIVFVGFMVFS